MSKPFVLIIALYLAFTFQPLASAPQVDWPAIVKPLTKQVVRVEVKDENGTSTCTGDVLNGYAGWILTAAHCAKGKPESTSITVAGSHAKIVKLNRILDMAVLLTEAKGLVTLPLAINEPEVGSEVAVAGFMLSSQTLIVQFGRVASLYEEQNTGILIDSVLLPGDSGGAMINKSGELIGMSRSYFRDTYLGVGVPLHTVRDFVKEYLPVGVN